MGTQAKTSSPEEHKEKSFFAKAWRATKDFVIGTVKTLPMTLITSGAALGLSLLATHVTGGLVNDPLGVGGKFFERWIGTTVVFGLVGGGVKTWEGWNRPPEGEERQEHAPLQRSKAPRTLGQSKEHEFSTAPFTPPVEREVRAR